MHVHDTVYHRVQTRNWDHMGTTGVTVLSRSGAGSHLHPVQRGKRSSGHIKRVATALYTLRGVGCAAATTRSVPSARQAMSTCAAQSSPGSCCCLAAPRSAARAPSAASASATLWHIHHHANCVQPMYAGGEELHLY